jgi:hypothetical protein
VKEIKKDIAKNRDSPWHSSKRAAISIKYKRGRVEAGIP